MEITLNVPVIAGCEVRDCAYNTDNTCHAKAITVGDGVSPSCDTMVRHDMEPNEMNIAGVAACKVRDCVFNNDLECDAAHVFVGRHGDGAVCVTYTAL